MVMQLVADVGGTNARLALAREGRLIPNTERRFAGDDHATFDEVLALFLEAAGRPTLTAACVAVAGPVTAGRATLTNRDWSFTLPGLAAATGAPDVTLMNDLTALGHATATLTPHILRNAPAGRARNGQALVVGAGTGFNVCAVRALPSGRLIAMEAEEGHTALPATVARRLSDMLGPGNASQFFSTEDLFAGRGLACFHAMRRGIRGDRPEVIAAAAHAGDPDASASFAELAELFGRLLRELAMRFVPREGIWLAGSVARAMVPWLEQIEAGFLAEPLMRDIVQGTPLFLIEDDMAALQGCVNAITQ